VNNILDELIILGGSVRTMGGNFLQEWLGLWRGLLRMRGPLAVDRNKQQVKLGQKYHFNSCDMHDIMDMKYSS